MSRIRSDAVILGGSYVVGKDNATDLYKEQILNTAKQQAEAIIAQAQAQANEIIQNATQQSESMVAEIQKQAHETGFQNGYNDGYQNGFNQISNELANQVKTVEVLAKATFDVKKEIIISSEKDIIELTIAIAEKIIKTKLDLAPEILIQIVKSAISDLKEKEHVKISINPENAVHLYQYSEILKELINGLKNLKIIEDKTVPIDSFIVESIDSRIDAGIKTQINEITRELITEAQQNPSLEDIPEEIEIRINEKIIEENSSYDN